MSRIIPLAAGALAAAMLLPATTQVVSAKEYLIRYSDIGANRGPRAAALQVWKKEIEEESKGKLKIKFFWGQSLMKAKATLKGVGSGLAEMGTVIAAYTPADMPVLNYGNVPFNEPDPWIGIRAMQDVRENGSSSGRRKEEQDPDAVPKRYRPRASSLRQRADRHSRSSKARRSARSAAIFSCSSRWVRCR